MIRRRNASRRQSLLRRSIITTFFWISLVILGILLAASPISREIAYVSIMVAMIYLVISTIIVIRFSRIYVYLFSLPLITVPINMMVLFDYIGGNFAANLAVTVSISFGFLLFLSSIIIDLRNSLRDNYDRD